MIPTESDGTAVLIDDIGSGARSRPVQWLADWRGRLGGRIKIALTSIVPGFLVEFALLAAALEVLQLSGYGSQPVRTHNVPLGLLLVAAAWAIAEAHFRLYRRVWAVAGFPDAVAIAWAVIEATVLIGGANALLPDSIRPFRYLVPPLAAPSAIAMISVFRLWPRLRTVARRGGKRLLVVAPDSATFPLIRWMVITTPSGWEPVAILTMEPSTIGKTVHGVPVAGPTEEIERWSDVYRVDGVAFIPSGALASTWKVLVGRCVSAGLPIFVVPALEEALQGGTEAQLRSLTADDLVGRTPRGIDLERARAMVEGNTVMVTGAAGSIGSELCRLLTSLAPRRLVLLDNNESGLFEIAQELRTVGGDTQIEEALTSIVDRAALLGVFRREEPAIVFHAAAYKHVPLLEAHPAEAVRTNVLGTQNILVCAESVGTKTFVLISTDKAVSRQSIMGCSKRLCEMLVLGFQGSVNCWAVRFGNVVGSRGSVVPTFERQIHTGGPVTITHPQATRYLMTIREAASLVISTLSLGSPGHLYMLDMGEPISIESLACSLIRSRGLRPGDDIEIVYTGLRPGESLTEDLLASDETSSPTKYPGVLEVLSPSLLPLADMDLAVRRMRSLLEDGKQEDLISLLRWTADAHPDSGTAPDSNAVSKVV